VNRIRLLVVMTAVAFMALAPASRAQSPADDPFYGVPAGISGLPNGTVIDARPVTATQYSDPIDADAWQVRFKTQDTTGAASAYIATVLVPHTPWAGQGSRPVLSYQMAEDGVGLKCSPSWVLTHGASAPSNTTPEGQTVASAIDRGWTVVVPDYEGPNSAWLGAAGQGRGVIDALRAARAFAPAKIDPKAPVGLWGYSGGAIASSVAAQLQPSYAPDVRLAGVALGGNNASIREGLRAFDGSAVGGAIVIGFIGLDRAYPDLHLTDLLNDQGRADVAASQQDCIADASARHPLLRSSDVLKDPRAIDQPPMTTAFRRASPLTFPGTPAAPVYDYHAAEDELAPIGPSQQLLERFCRAGVTVQSVEETGDHFTEVGNGQAGAMAFLADRFAGRAPVNTCRVAPDPKTKPSHRACTSRRSFLVRLRVRGRLASVRATLGRRRVAVRWLHGRYVVRVRLGGRRAGLVRLRVVGRTRSEKRFVQTRTYRVCGQGRRS
jgi:hypothetical protein